VVDSHIQALEHAKIDLGIASWWGPGTHSESVRIPLILDRTAASGSPIRWALYYELEGSADPAVTQIQADLQYAMANYAGRPEYATMHGKPVVFVYSANDVSCDVADRWAAATAGQWYVSLKVFSGYRTCANQPDTWHQYSGATSSDQQAGRSYTISPGFWKADEGTPRLPRDLDRWRRNVREMVASGEPWQLVVSFNEWGEGTAVESAVEWSDAYLDALSNDGGVAPPPGQVTFGAGGDHGANARTAASLAALDDSGADFYLAIGDLDYDETVSDEAWCDYVKERLPKLGASFPFQLVVGNHEEQGGEDGYIVNHAGCLPDRMSSTVGPGSRYGAEYYFDYPPSSPLMRVVMIPANLTVESINYSYAQGTPRYSWLAGVIDGARASGIPWVVVGVHKNCITTGQKTCEIGADLMNLLVEKKVDLVLQGHEHSYQRSKQLALNPSSCPAVPVGSYDPDCVIDDGTDAVYPKGSGATFVIAGAFGSALAPVNAFDPEAPYFAKLDATSSGFVKYTVTPDRIDAVFVSSVGTFTDAFTILVGQSPQADIAPPTAPSELIASAPEQTRVDLSWTASTDDIGVHHYAVFRDGAAIGSADTPAYVDASVVGGRTYTYQVTAYDAAGNPSPPSSSVTVTTPGVTSLAFFPTADTTVRADQPTQNLGLSTVLSTDGSPIKNLLMRFDVSGVGSGTVASAKLRLFNVDSSSIGGTFYRVQDNSWSEQTVTWNTAPVADTTPIASLGAVTANTWYEVDLTSLVTGDGTYSLRVTSTSTNGADYTSKEGAAGSRPQLVITVQP
jgi:hypothetical protein